MQRIFKFEMYHLGKQKQGLLKLRSCFYCQEQNQAIPLRYFPDLAPNQLPLNKHYRPAKSLFRLGLDRLRRVLKNSCAKNDQTTFLDLLNVLSRT
ncbi:MAG: hypothetical protein QS721_12120 [Candidatus Endonucleobacter sp. (ex Gigantidas childressi)]|nr:hypothetical protein [Candidatus Endonucleobacter sp. (ex Gigantidas childressi)]